MTKELPPNERNSKIALQVSTPSVPSDTPLRAPSIVEKIMTNCHGIKQADDSETTSFACQ